MSNRRHSCGSPSNQDLKCPVSQLSRRAFLTLTGSCGLALALHPISSRNVWAQGSVATSLIEIPGGSPLLHTREMQEIIRAGWGSLVVGGLALHQFRNMYNAVIRDVFDPRRLYGSNTLTADGQKLLNYYRTAGGTNWRSPTEAQALFRKVPGPIRVSGIEGLKEFHKGKNWSHIIPRVDGGPNTPGNGIWWSTRKNQQLGGRRMTLKHLIDAKSVLIWEGLRVGMLVSVKPLVTASLATMAIVGVLTILDLGAQALLGNITRQELVHGVFSAVWMAGKGSFVITGLLIGVALAFPVLLPLLEVVTITLAVVGFVLLLNDVIDLGRSWWAALDEQGHLDLFLADLREVEEFLSGLSSGRTGSARAVDPRAWSRLPRWLSQVATNADPRSLIPEFDYARYFPDRDWEMPESIAGIGQVAAQVLPDWRLTVPQWKFDIRLGQLVPDFGLVEHLPVLDLNVREVLSGLELPSLDNLELPLPDFHLSARSAQMALVNASAYLASQGKLVSDTNPG